MKRSIKQAEKEASASKKNTRPFTAKKAGYKEDVFNSEEQHSYNKSKIADNSKKNTSGPNS